MITNFYSHASCEAWRELSPIRPTDRHFYSHASCEAWLENKAYYYLLIDFYSHASCEAWRVSNLGINSPIHFYSHASCEAWLWQEMHRCVTERFLLTCLLRGMTFTAAKMGEVVVISTHMPLARHDGAETTGTESTVDFYSHASCEAWLLHSGKIIDNVKFLLTCLLRGMTSLTTTQTRTWPFLLTCLLRGMIFRWYAVRHISQFLLTCLLRGMTLLKM